MRTPEGSRFNFSDCELAAPRPWLMAALAARYRNLYWQWNALKNIGSGLEDLLFLDTGLAPQSPQTLPLGKYFRKTETVSMRSSWRDDAVFLGFKSGQTIANHSHLDLSSFVLHAFGRPLLMETETWP